MEIVGSRGAVDGLWAQRSGVQAGTLPARLVWEALASAQPHPLQGI